MTLALPAAREYCTGLDASPAGYPAQAAARTAARAGYREYFKSRAFVPGRPPNTVLPAA